MSGYTGYLAGVELDHTQDILADLMNVIVGGLRPPFILAKFEGDAAFVFGRSDGIDGSAVQDAVEGTYFAFKRRLRDIHHATTCECNACTLIPSLDLKFIVHDGIIARQTVADREEVVGSDVIPDRRCSKATAAESWRRVQGRRDLRHIYGADIASRPPRCRSPSVGGVPLPDIPQMTSKFAEIVPRPHLQGNSVPIAAIR